MNIKKGLNTMLSFLKIGCIGFGGGTSLIPVIEQEMVENKGVITKSEYDEDVIVASITPGALPVEISGSIGRRKFGIKGMLLASLLMALPGAILTVLLLSGLSSVSKDVLKQIEIISVGITAFIISMLFKYISNTFTWAKHKTRQKGGLAIGIMIAVFLLNSGKSFCKFLGLLGIKTEPVFSISTIDILILTFFILFYTKCKYNIPKLIICSFIGVSYLLCNSGFTILDSNINTLFIRFLQCLMAMLAIYGIVTDKEMKLVSNFKGTKEFVVEELSWLIFLALLSIPAIFVLPQFFNFIGRGYLSSVMSFGGGDAYLTVADSMFVDTKMISEDNFYGQLVTVVNILPGSILCKTLTGIGYYLGYSINGSILTGCLVALSGFACSIVGSCSTVSLVKYILKLFKRIRALEVLTSWIKTIISGLLGSVILSLINQSLNVAVKYNSSILFIFIELVAILVINIILNKYLKNHTALRVIISCVIALSAGNVII